MIEVPVLIAVGGPVGLTASFLLSRLGIKLLRVERHPRNAGLPPERVGFIVWARTLAGEEIERRVPWGQSARRAEVTPVRACLCAQDYFEPVLRRAAEQQPLGTQRFNTEMTTFEQTEAGVTATLVDTVSGATEKVVAQYVIAADGTQSRIRQTLGIAMHGQKDVYDSVNILIKADLR